MKFKDMKLDTQIIHALDENQIESPTLIQEKSIPRMLEDEKCHIIAQAKTGSGKTFAFSLPIVEKINLKNRQIQAVIMVPTRELCRQVSQVFNILTKYKKLSIVEIYGGVSINNQIEKIRNGAQIVIATPGRLIDIYNRRQISFKNVKFVVLDEADRMLDMGFLPDIRFILLDAMKYAQPRLMLYSATLADEIKKTVIQFTKKDPLFEINVSEDTLIVEDCEQYLYHVDNNKFWGFVKILQNENPDYSLVFTRTKHQAKELCSRLKDERNLGLKVEYIHGDVSQAKREEVIDMFRKKKITCLVGTDVLARGLDFPKVSHVFNYDLPRDPEDYIHRIGRTARTSGIDKAIIPGKAISLVSKNQKEYLRPIEKLIDKKIEVRNLTGIPNISIKRKKKADDAFIKIAEVNDSDKIVILKKKTKIPQSKFNKNYKKAKKGNFSSQNQNKVPNFAK